MDKLSNQVSKKDIRKIEKAYKNLYKKSKSLINDSYEQDKILDKVFEEKMLEAFNHMKSQNLIITEEKSVEFFRELRLLTQKWKAEMEADFNDEKTKKKKKWWEFWNC